MNPIRKQRLIFVLLIVTGVAVAVGFTTYALRQNINAFYTPSQIAAGEARPGQHIRAGGLVVVGSVKKTHEGQTLKTSFVLADGVSEVTVRYEGLLPDLFREGQGILAKGQLESDGVLYASEVLAKHDENYMSPEVKAAMDAAKQRTGSSMMPSMMPTK